MMIGIIITNLLRKKSSIPMQRNVTMKKNMIEPTIAIRNIILTYFPYHKVPEIH